jgi:hypothetical protein
MDRDELDARIRQRRGPETPYRRGGYADEWGGDPGGYGQFEPEPEDALAVRDDAMAPDAPRIDRVDDAYEPPAARDDFAADQQAPASWPAQDDVPPPPSAAWQSAAAPEPTPPPADPWRRGREVDEPSSPEAADVPIAAAAAVPDPWQSPPPAEPLPPEAPVYDERAYGDDAGAYGADEGWDPQTYAQPPYEEAPRRGGGLALVAFLAVGAVALVVGAFLSGIFNNNGVASASPTPTATVATTTTPVQTIAPTPTGTASASGSVNASEGPPIIFPDGFVAQTQACSTQPNGSGCNSDGATNDGSMWVWIGFEKGHRDDVIGMTILDAAGAVSAQASIELSQLGCGATGACNGWILFPGFGTPYTGLDAGAYRIRINRNGLPAAEADFTVS